MRQVLRIPALKVGPLLALVLGAATARADILVADWSDKTTDIAIDSSNTIRTMALTQGAVYVAVNAITGQYPRDRVALEDIKGASVDAAVAAASRAVLLHESAPLKERIESAYEAAIRLVPDTPARASGIHVGEQAAAKVLAQHSDDLGNPEPYRPVTPAGAYVPTVFPLGYAVAQHKPWYLNSGSQFRPGPPTDLKSERWARDYNEVKSIGSATSTTRTPEQTEIARFWATALPDVHMSVARSFAIAAGREVTRNARFFAMVTGAMSDAEIAVFEAKYHYQFWRPITAIRNGDTDGNDATERDANWVPLIVTPVQPEYPCAHCVIAAVIATVIRADAGKDPMPPLSGTSNTARGVTRHWKQPEEVEHEVAEARIYDGVHYRYSSEVGAKLGEQVARVVIAAFGLT